MRIPDKKIHFTEDSIFLLDLQDCYEVNRNISEAVMDGDWAFSCVVISFIFSQGHQGLFVNLIFLSFLWNFFFPEESRCLLNTCPECVHKAEDADGRKRILTC